MAQGLKAVNSGQNCDKAAVTFWGYTWWFDRKKGGIFKRISMNFIYLPPTELEVCLPVKRCLAKHLKDLFPSSMVTFLMWNSAILETLNTSHLQKKKVFIHSYRTYYNWLRYNLPLWISVVMTFPSEDIHDVTRRCSLMKGGMRHLKIAVFPT